MNLTADVWIDASSEVVWKQVVDPAFWTMIVPFLTQAELLGPPPLATGSKLRFTFDRAGRRLTSEAEVPELTPPRRLVRFAFRPKEGNGSTGGSLVGPCV